MRAGLGFFDEVRDLCVDEMVQRVLVLVLVDFVEGACIFLHSEGGGYGSIWRWI